jgi:hypothetical protein
LRSDSSYTSTLGEDPFLKDVNIYGYLSPRLQRILNAFCWNPKMGWYQAVNLRPRDERKSFENVQYLRSQVYVARGFFEQYLALAGLRVGTSLVQLHLQFNQHDHQGQV